MKVYISYFCIVVHHVLTYLTSCCFITASVTVFFEDHPSAVHVINGTIVVSDPDNPIYPLHSAEAQITPYNAGPSEVLYLQDIPTGLNSSVSSLA